MHVGHCDDVAEVIRLKLNSITHRAKGPIDAFTMIYQSGLARKLSWEAQVEEAVKDEPDEFWQQVHNKTDVTSYRIYAFCVHAGSTKDSKHAD